MKYDPDKHGDGYRKSIPMTVKPPTGSNVLLHTVFRGVYKADGILVKSGEEWSKIQPIYTGWTFRPFLSEPPKSYAEYLDEDDRGHRFFRARELTDHGDPAIYAFAVRSEPERARALIDFIQDTLSDLEPGE